MQLVSTECNVRENIYLYSKSSVLNRPQTANGFAPITTAKIVLGFCMMKHRSIASYLQDQEKTCTTTVMNWDFQAHRHCRNAFRLSPRPMPTLAMYKLSYVYIYICKGAVVIIIFCEYADFG